MLELRHEYSPNCGRLHAWVLKILELALSRPWTLAAQMVHFACMTLHYVGHFRPGTPVGQILDQDLRYIQK